MLPVPGALWIFMDDGGKTSGDGDGIRKGRDRTRGDGNGSGSGRGDSDSRDRFLSLFGLFLSLVAGLKIYIFLSGSDQGVF